MHYLGKLSQQLYRATIASQTQPEPGAPVVDSQGNQTGTTVIAARHPQYPEKSLYKVLMSIKNKSIHEPLFIENTLIQAIEPV